MNFGILKPNNFNPLNRCFHTAVVYKDSMVIHGGEAGSEAMTQKTLINETWMFYFNKKIWKKMPEMDNAGVEPRKYHRACVMG